MTELLNRNLIRTIRINQSGRLEAVVTSTCKKFKKSIGIKMGVLRLHVIPEIVMPGWLNKITRRKINCCPARFTLTLTNEQNKERFITAGLPRLTHCVQLAASSVLSEQPDSWLNKQRGEAALPDRSEREEKLMIPALQAHTWGYVH